MFCPNDQCPDFVNTGLRSEYRLDVTVCPYCGSHLVETRPDNPPRENEEIPTKPRVADDEVMEPVIEAADPTEVAVIKSVLDAASIPYTTRGEDQFNAFRGTFAGGSIFNPGFRGVVFSVPSRMADEARILLEEFDSPIEEG